MQVCQCFIVDWMNGFPLTIGCQCFLLRLLLIGESLSITSSWELAFTLRNRTYIFDEDFSNNIREQIHWDQFIVGRIGYRYQKSAGGFFFRAGYTPMVEFNNSDTVYNGISLIPFGLGISLGMSF